VQHLGIIEGGRLIGYICAMFFVYIFALVMVFDVITTVKQHLSAYHKSPVNDRIYPRFGDCILIMTDIVIISLMVVAVSLQISYKVGSREVVGSLLDDLTGIPWSSSEVSVREKKDTFFSSVQELLLNIQQDAWVDFVLNIVLLMLLVSVMQTTSLHPRLALLTGTISNSLDDFWHSALLILLIMGAFAGIGTGRFGGSKAEFATWEKSMQTEFMMILCDFTEVRGWGDDPELSVFVVLYLAVMFLVILNFLLAIIVENYMKQRRLIIDIETEMEFFTDCACIARSHILGLVHGWPQPFVLWTLVKRQKQKLNYGFMDLWATGLFRDQKAVVQFVRWYGGYEFLEPVEVTAFGKVESGDERQLKEIEKRVANLLGMRLPTLTEQAQMGTMAVLPSKTASRTFDTDFAGFPLSSGSIVNRGNGNGMSSPRKAISIDRVDRALDSPRVLSPTRTTSGGSNGNAFHPVFPSGDTAEPLSASLEGDEVDALERDLSDAMK